MIRRVFLAAVVLGLMFPTASFVWGADHGAHGYLDIDGVQRHYLLATPEGEGPWPLILVMHGVNGWANQFAGVTRLAERGTEAGYAVAHVDAVGPVPRVFQGWNALHCCGYGRSRGVPDAGHLMVMADHLERTGVADGDVFLVGFSNGAMLAHHAAGTHPDRVDGFAVYAGSVGSDHVELAPPLGPVPALLMHGGDDPVVPLEGRPAGVPGWPFPPFAASVEHWTKANQARRVAGGDGSVAWEDLDGVAPVRVRIVHGADHHWPGGAPNPFGAEPNGDLDATHEVLAFFDGLR